MREIVVQAKSDHIASMASSSPLGAIEELVWNALDADAREVKVDVITNALGGIDAVRVTDDGSGVDILHADDNFGSLGGSWKSGCDVTPLSRRRLHGRRGRGRFKAFAIGAHVEWRTTTETDKGLVSYVIAGEADRPGVFSLEEQTPGPATGTEVWIANIRANSTVLLDAGTCVQALAAKFALYLKAYPRVTIFFCGIPVTPVIVQKVATEYPIRLASGAEAKLEVIEWKRKFVGTGKLVFCGDDGFALHETIAGVRPGAGYSFTAYLVASRFSELAAENALVMDELHPEVRAYLDAARKLLRDHFKVLSAQADRNRVLGWINEKIYPFGIDEVSPRREAFDAALAELRSHVDGFDALPVADRRYFFEMLLKLNP